MNPNQQSAYDNPQLQQARGAYEGAQRQATQTEASAMNLPSMLKETLNKKFSADNPLVQGREQAVQNFLTVAERAPLDVTARSAGGTADVVYNPLEQASLIGAKRAGALAPLSTANLLLGLAQGGIADVVGSTSQAAQAEARRVQGEASLKRQSYQDLLDEITRKQEEEFRNRQLQESLAQQARDEAFRERQFNESIRQFNTQEGRLGKASGGGGFDIASLLSAMDPQQVVKGAQATRPSLDSFVTETKTPSAQKTQPKQTVQKRSTGQGLFSPLLSAGSSWLRNLSIGRPLVGLGL